tara:strand:+ start:452 stop:1210 length:759 start_codon:yes stop_codon:yes gene_type:complete
MKNTSPWLLLLLIGCSGLLDETPPSPPYNLKGYFTLTQNNPRVNLSWTHSVDDDISIYQVFKSVDEGASFEYLGESGSSMNSYVDTATLWLENIFYKVRAKDGYDNIGEFSDSVFITCYKPAGNWKIEGKDSTFICVDPSTYSTPEVFRLNLEMPLDSIGDTNGIMDFTEIVIDTIQFSGSGWMYYTFEVVEESADSLSVDTVIYANTIAPEYCTINLSEPGSGLISFYSEDFADISLIHDLTSCEGDTLFP